MSSCRKVLLDTPGVGKLLCQKKDPSKVSFWIEAQAYKDRALTIPRKGVTEWYEVRSVPTWWLELMIKGIAKKYEYYQEAALVEPYRTNQLNGCCLALDYLYAELGRRVDKGVIS